MLQILGDAEEQRIAKSSIVHLCERHQCPPVAKFESTAVENVGAQIQAEPHLALALLVPIVVPR
jgi:hypothetical protein